jgi:hypothetical protein
MLYSTSDNDREIEVTKEGLEKLAVSTSASQNGCKESEIGALQSPASEEDEGSGTSKTTDEEEVKEEKDVSQKSVDPIRWYGVLVPPALRAAQSQFISAVEGPIPRVANLSKEMRILEIEVGRTRKTMKKLGKV